MKKVLFVVGPTATGKSKLALQVALVPQIPIINGDSVQVYKGLKIGSAVPSREDLKLTPHHLYCYVDKGKTSTAAQHVSDVESLLKEKKDQHTWILCGGSGFYIQALEKGMYPVREPSEAVKAQAEKILQEKGWVETHAWLLKEDPSLAQKVHPNDQYRIRRGLQIYLESKTSQEDLQKELRPGPFAGFEIIKVGLTAPRDQLRGRVQRRVQGMLKEGFVEEVEELIEEGLQDWAPLSSVGYFEVKEHVLGRISRADLEERIVTAHMQLIKKQMTWFQRDSEIQWFDPEDLASAQSFAKKSLKLD